MPAFTRIRAAARRANLPAILAGLALAASYSVTIALQAKTRRRKALPQRRHQRRDNVALSAPLTGWPYCKHLLYRVYEEINDDRLLALAAGVVFYALLALFPAITALVSSYALFAAPATIGAHLSQIQDLMPPGAFQIVSEQVNRIVKGTGGLSVAFAFGLLLALWSANAGIKAIIDALNIVYGVKEKRGFIRLNLVSLAFTVGAIGSLLLAIGGIVVVPVVISYLPYFGFGGYASSALPLLRWPVLILLLLSGLAVLYRFGPDRVQPRWQWLSAGAIFAALAWLAGSALLSWYLGSFANYDATYGSLGAAIGLMMWLWLSAIVVLVGAELNSEIDAEDELPAPFPQAGPDRIGGL
ncbi:MAG: YihY/virulence factor BrkB family protein [Pseudolabrys sp.]